MFKILMVDDDTLVLSDNRRYFEQKNYQVICATTAAEAASIISSASLDCAILDINLPDEDGFSLCCRIREKTGLPIVFLSGYSEEQIRIKGLSIGGDDYVCKPYSLEELELRVRARIRSGRLVAPPQDLQYGQLLISPGRRCISNDNATISLSSYEFDLLYFLALHPGRVFTCDQIFDQIWKTPMNQGIKTLQMTIVRLRHKLMELCPSHAYIQTVRRKGYMFVK